MVSDKRELMLDVSVKEVQKFGVQKESASLGEFDEGVSMQAGEQDLYQDMIRILLT